MTIAGGIVIEWGIVYMISPVLTGALLYSFRADWSQLEYPSK
jgi:hypothetical protein